MTDSGDKPSRSIRDLAWFLLYNLLLILGLPILVAWLIVRKLVFGKGDGWSQRLGASPRFANPYRRPIWVHAVSAGEAAAAAPLVRTMAARWPETPIVVSTLTPAGKAMAERLCPEAVSVFYFPWDLLPSVRTSLNRVRPRAVLLMEAEFWPNFLSTCRSRRIPVVVANGRISDRGLRRARKVAPAMRWIYGLVDAFGMQSREDADRAVSLGAPADRVTLVGQTKFDQEERPLSAAEADALRREIGIPYGARVVVGGSMRPGEEEAMLDLLNVLRPMFPDLRLVLAPRHLERLEEVESLASGRGWRVVRRTCPRDDADVVVLDTMGELGRIYAVATLCFVGGTLADIGGHNLLQPVAQGKPVFFGPHTQNVRDIAQLLKDAGVGFEIEDAGELIREVGEMLNRPDDLARLESRALELVEANRGASERYIDLLASVLGKDP